MTRRRLIRGLVLAAFFSLLVYAALAALTDARAVGESLRSFPLGVLAAMLALTLACYVLRAVRWWFFARSLGYRASVPDAVYIHFSGMTMTITPGKVGEVLKAYLARELVGLPMTRGVTLLFSERLTDLIAVLVLSIGGLSVFVRGSLWFPGALAVVVAGTLLLSSERFHARALRYVLRREWMQRHHASAAAISETLQKTLSLRPLLVAITLSVLAWGSEGTAFYLCVRGLGFAELGFWTAVAVYAISTVVGALLLLPGGIGLTEASLAGLLIAAGASGDVATAATLLIRVVTLWFGVALGWAVMATRPALLSGFLGGEDGGGAGARD